MNKNELKTCPFCGGHPTFIQEIDLSIPGFKFHNFIVKCNRYRCRVMPRVANKSKREAMEAWNTRGEGGK